jgi:hypothetical protein
MRVQQVMGEARQKLAAGDAKACLATIDTDLGWKTREASPALNQASMAMIYDGEMLGLKAQCQAASGDCAGGVATAKDGIRLMAAGNDIQAPGSGLKQDAEKRIAAGEAERSLGKWCGHH